MNEATTFLKDQLGRLLEQGRWSVVLERPARLTKRWKKKKLRAIDREAIAEENVGRHGRHVKEKKKGIERLVQRTAAAQIEREISRVLEGHGVPGHIEIRVVLA